VQRRNPSHPAGRNRDRPSFAFKDCAQRSARSAANRPKVKLLGTHVLKNPSQKDRSGPVSRLRRCCCSTGCPSRLCPRFKRQRALPYGACPLGARNLRKRPLESSAQRAVAARDARALQAKHAVPGARRWRVFRPFGSWLGETSRPRAPSLARNSQCRRDPRHRFGSFGSPFSRRARAATDACAAFW